MTGHPPLVRKRGRPPKLREVDNCADPLTADQVADRRTHTFGSADPLTTPQKDALRSQVLALPKVCAMPHAMQEILIEELVYRLPYGVVVADIVSRGRPGVRGPRRGPRYKQHMMTLLADCAKALEAATGEAQRMWETSGAGREALPCAIARIAIKIAFEKRSPHVGRLHRQIKAATRALADPLTAI